jgi:hypothetical protein
MCVVCDQLAAYSPIDNPTQYIGDKENGERTPLNGPWKSLFTTAADANFLKNSKCGAAIVQNIIKAHTKSTITNVIDLLPKEDVTELVLKQLNVVIKAMPVNTKQIELQFKHTKALLTKFLWFKWKWVLYIPVPGPFLTQGIVFLSHSLKFVKKGGNKKIWKGYFHVMFLDDDLRVHRTGEGDNIFVQGKETWKDARPFLE